MNLSVDDLDSAPAGAGVFAIHRTTGEPYLGRTGVLRRRLKRLLGPLRPVATTIEYWPTGSLLESQMLLYRLARMHLPGRYLQFLKLRIPPFVRLTYGTAWPRTQVTTHITGAGQYYGPFRTRAAAEEFEHHLLDLFQIRRCQEDLVPAPDHPGCIYGEMGMCLRPCQEAVSDTEYAGEVQRVSEFLATSGRAALQSAASARDRLSSEMEFEAAAQQHKRVERIEALLKVRDDLARDIDSLTGVAVTPSALPGAVQLWPLFSGCWQQPIDFAVADNDSESMDSRVRRAVESITPEPAPRRERGEHLAILARWFYSSWRDGTWIEFDKPARIPYRRLVNAVARTVHESSPAASQ